jgi:hypothetical protein
VTSQGDALPGQDLIEAGLRDLSSGTETIPALLVSIGAPRLAQLGIEVSNPISDPERRLYSRLAEEDGDAAHSRYNALVRRLVSFERGCGVRELADRDRIERFMRVFGAEAVIPIRVYFTGGATAVLIGWRGSTIDVDIRVEPDTDALFRAIPRIKEDLHLNVKLASPADFIPVRPDWQDRSPFVAQHGRATFYHFDLYAQALAKVERSHRQDLEDVREMLTRGLIQPEGVWEYFAVIQPLLFRYPAIDEPSFKRSVERIVGARPDTA